MGLLDDPALQYNKRKSIMDAQRRKKYSDERTKVLSVHHKLRKQQLHWSNKANFATADSTKKSKEFRSSPL